MNVIKAVEMIKQKFAEVGNPAQIPNRKGERFEATMVGDGVEVGNLGDSPFLPWAVFQEAVCILIQNGGRAKRGDVMGPRLGDPELPLNSVEGHIAQVVYGHPVGRAIFRRIVPIDGILVWAGICTTAPNELILCDID